MYDNLSLPEACTKPGEDFYQYYLQDKKDKKILEFTAEVCLGGSRALLEIQKVLFPDQKIVIPEETDYDYYLVGVSPGDKLVIANNPAEIGRVLVNHYPGALIPINQHKSYFQFKVDGKDYTMGQWRALSNFQVGFNVNTKKIQFDSRFGEHERAFQAYMEEDLIISPFTHAMIDEHDEHVANRRIKAATLVINRFAFQLKSYRLHLHKRFSQDTALGLQALLQRPDLMTKIEERIKDHYKDKFPDEVSRKAYLSQLQAKIDESLVYAKNKTAALINTNKSLEDKNKSMQDEMVALKEKVRLLEEQKAKLEDSNKGLQAENTKKTNSKKEFEKQTEQLTAARKGLETKTKLLDESEKKNKALVQENAELKKNVEAKSASVETLRQGMADVMLKTLKFENDYVLLNTSARQTLQEHEKLKIEQEKTARELLSKKIIALYLSKWVKGETDKLGFSPAVLQSLDLEVKAIESGSNRDLRVKLNMASQAMPVATDFDRSKNIIFMLQEFIQPYYDEADLNDNARAILRFLNHDNLLRFSVGYPKCATTQDARYSLIIDEISMVKRIYESELFSESLEVEAHQKLMNRMMLMLSRLKNDAVLKKNIFDAMKRRDLFTDFFVKNTAVITRTIKNNYILDNDAVKFYANYIELSKKVEGLKNTELVMAIQRFIDSTTGVTPDELSKLLEFSEKKTKLEMQYHLWHEMVKDYLQKAKMDHTTTRTVLKKVFLTFSSFSQVPAPQVLVDLHFQSMKQHACPPFNQPKFGFDHPLYTGITSLLHPVFLQGLVNKFDKFRELAEVQVLLAIEQMKNDNLFNLPEGRLADEAYLRDFLGKILDSYLYYCEKTSPYLTIVALLIKHLCGGAPSLGSSSTGKVYLIKPTAGPHSAPGVLGQLVSDSATLPITWVKNK
jgi:hypothetical protein